MDIQALLENANRYTLTSEFNYISKVKALSDELVSTKIFEEPLIAIAKADDTKFRGLQAEGVIGEHFVLPEDWLSSGKSVVSFFLPYTEAIRNSNKLDMSYPSKGWLNGRIEGQFFINKFSEFIVENLKTSGFKTIAPSIDKRFFSNTDEDNKGIGKLHTINWSERHVAYVCGMGTFSLSKGIITEKGMAGRLTSIVTELDLPPDNKEFKRFDENCTMCGKCLKNCPVNAISFEQGKNHELCSSFLNSVLAKHAPWYGCGKCQVNVPCEKRNPQAR